MSNGIIIYNKRAKVSNNIYISKILVQKRMALIYYSDKAVKPLH